MTPNSRTHWTLLVVGVAGGVVFNLTWFVEGLVRPGYDAVREPVSALSLGGAGWVQVADFVLFGVVGCVNAFGWRPTLAPGSGAVWYPRLRFVVGLAIGTASPADLPRRAAARRQVNAGRRAGEGSRSSVALRSLRGLGCRTL